MNFLKSRRVYRLGSSAGVAHDLLRSRNSAELHGLFRKSVELVRDRPGGLAARFNPHIDVRLRTKSRADGPEDQLGERPVAGESHAHPRSPAYEAAICVPGCHAKTFQFRQIT